MQRLLQVYVWNNEAYQDGTNALGQCKWQGLQDIRIEAEVEVDFEVDIDGWGTQWPEGLIAPDRELELDK